MPANHALFAFMFDHHSTVARKNAFGLIAAFAGAFGQDHHATLVIKTLNAASVPETAADLVAAASAHAPAVFGATFARELARLSA